MNNRVKKEKIEEAIITLAKCIDHLEYPYLKDREDKDKIRTREELIREILEKYE